MEIAEAVQRVVRRHLLLIVCCVLGAVAVALTAQDGTARYTATTRVELASQPNRSSVEAEARVAAARALGTSTSLVSEAIAAADVDRDAALVAERDVEIELLGISPVATLTVRDRDAATAVALANALASVLAKRLSLEGCDVDRRLAVLDQQLADLRAERGGLERRIAGLPASSPLLPDLQNRLGGTSALLSELDAERRATQVASCDSAAVLDSALQASPTQGTIPKDVVLAVLLGGLLGVGVASALETVRPTVGGPRELSRMFDAPVLARSARDLSRWSPEEVDSLGVSVRLAARAHEVATVVLTDGHLSQGLLALTRRLDAGAPARADSTPVSLRDQTAARRARVVERPVDEELSALHAFPDVVPATAEQLSRASSGIAPVGLVVVAALSQRRDSLEPAGDLARASGWPVIGVVTYRRTRLLQARARPRRRTP